MVDATASANSVVAEGFSLEEDYAGARDLPVHTVRSADGTAIAYEVSGRGPAAVVIGGGLNDRAMFTPFSRILSKHFRVYNYDRRGRGGSELGDRDRYTIDREVEDLAAVIAATGEPAHVFANCTGGMIAIHAAASGVPMAKLALYEPPYLFPKITPDKMTLLRQYVMEDRREEAVTLFGKEVVGFISEETLENFKQHPAWQAFLSMAPSLIYDAIISEQHTSIPWTLLPKVAPPTVILCGTDTAASIQEACGILAEEIPGGRLMRLAGEGHLFNQTTGAPLVAEYFSAD